MVRNPLAQHNRMSKMDSIISYYPPPNHPMLGRDEVHVWRACLDRDASYVKSLWQILSADEQIRAEQFYFDKHRKRFIIARGTLRVILSRYLDMKPEQLHFGYSDYGKPSLMITSDQEPLSFNVSHSCGLALFAVTRSRAVGIDLERIRPNMVYEQIAERFFSPQEKAILHTLSDEREKCKAFFSCWTRKEAYLKARGAGLSLPLERFSVSLSPGEPPRLLDHLDDPAECSRWSMVELTIDPSFAATLAVGGHGWQLACWEWPQEMEIRKLVSTPK